MYFAHIFIFLIFICLFLFVYLASKICVYFCSLSHTHTNNIKLFCSNVYAVIFLSLSLSLYLSVYLFVYLSTRWAIHIIYLFIFLFTSALFLCGNFFNRKEGNKTGAKYIFNTYFAKSPLVCKKL